MTLFQHGVSCSHLYQHTLTLWSVTMQPLAADLSTIPHMKEDIHIFHLRYGSIICTKRLQSYGGCKLYARTSLVHLNISILVRPRQQWMGLDASLLEERCIRASSLYLG